jgi:Uma2 family endonuclease
MSKVVEWFSVGVRLIWVIYPESGTVHVLRRDGSGAWFGPGGQLSGEDVIPGFTCSVDELFLDT